jgi:uncharacterized protein
VIACREFRGSIRLSTFTEQLWDLPSALTEAALHGTTCGVLCGAPELSADAYRRALIELLEPVEEMHRDEVERFVTLAAEDLDAPDLGFVPLLVDPEAPLGERLMALSQWADGFVAGFEDVGGELDDDALEAYDDIVAIAEVDVEAYEDDGDEGFDLEAVSEHLKIAVLTIRATVVGSLGEQDDEPQ